MLSILQHNVLIERLKMVITQTSNSGFGETSRHETISFKVFCWNIIKAPIDFSFSYVMAGFDVFRIALEELKIFYSVVSLKAVKMMHFLVMEKFSANVFFHDVSMMKNSFAIYIYTQIAKFCKAGCAFFKVGIIWGYIVRAMSPKAKTMFSASLSVIKFQDRLATAYFAYFSSCHKNIISRWEKKGKCYFKHTYSRS